MLVPLLLVAAATGRADPPVKVFAHPDRIRYDGQCLTIDGRPVFIFSGSFPYFRCPKALWRERFEKIKAAGCNAVETYVPWNYHERKMPASPGDFSQIDLREFRAWLRMAQDEFGLYTIIRPGPYICAEWDGGGFPRWLLTKMPAAAKQLSGTSVDVQAAAGNNAGGSAARGVPAAERIWLRSDNPVFLAWCRHWLQAVCRVVAPEQVTRRAPGTGGVILFQIENEYDLYRDVPVDERAPALRALYRAAVKGGIEVPIFTCWTKQCRESSDPELSQVFDVFNTYPRNQIDVTGRRVLAVEAAQPDAPAMISELQGGWFAAVGGKLSADQPGLSAAQLNADTLLAIQEGATILNYYVLSGGTNFGLWAGRGITTTYDYDAPIREPGGVGAKYLAMKAIGLMLRKYGSVLARSLPLAVQAESGSSDVTVAGRRGRDGSTFLFFRNHSLTAARKGGATVWLGQEGETRIDYALAPFGFAVFRLPPKETDAGRGEWLLKPVAGPGRPKQLPRAVRPSMAEMRTDPGATDWVVAGPGDMLPELGVDDARPVVYAATLRLSTAQVAVADALRLDPYSDDRMAAEVNGHVVPFGVLRSAVVGPWLRAGPNRIQVLYAQAGQANFGPTIQDEDGLRGAVLATAAGEVRIAGWKVGRRLGGIAAGWPALGPGTIPGWTSVALDPQTRIPREGRLADVPTGSAAALATWYRVAFTLPAPAPHVWVPWGASIEAAGDGELYLNGHPLGRYWEEGPQRKFYLPECWLHFGPAGENVLTLCLSPVRKGVALRAVDVAPYADQAEVRP